MPCEHYKDALIEVAASGGALQGELRAHLDECASCRAAFDAEQSLLAAIDSSLHVAANAEVPPSLLPRVRAELEHARVRPRFTLLEPFVLASASVALVLVVFLMFRPHRANPENVAKQAPVVAPTPITPVVNANPEKTSTPNTQIPAIRGSQARAARGSTIPRSAASGNPEVLVPPDEREAFARFANHDAVVVARAPQPPADFVEIRPVEVADLKVDALDKDSGSQAGSKIR